MYQIGHKQTISWWVILAATLGLLLFLYFSGLLSWLVGVFVWLTNPAGSGFIRLGEAVSPSRSVAELTVENEKLKQDLQLLALDYSQLKSLEVENQLLHQQLSFLEGQIYNFVEARVVAHSAQNNLSALIINRGSQDGLQVGYPVIAGEGVLVGRLVEVQDHSSTFLLLTDSQSKIAASLQNQDQTVGVVVGEHGLSIKLDMIPRDEAVAEGQTVITSGLQENIPRGLLIGLVDKIDATSSELFLKAYLLPLMDYQKLTLVTVLLPGANRNN